MAEAEMWKEVIAIKGAIIRHGVELDSPLAPWTVAFGSRVRVVETKATSAGATRHCVVDGEKRQGWCSAKVLRDADGAGTPPLEPPAIRLKRLADEAYRNKNYGDAIAAYDAAIEADGANPALYSNRAACRERVYARTKATAQIDGGLADGRRAISLDPTFARAYQRLAAFLALAVGEAICAAALKGGEPETRREAAETREAPEPKAHRALRRDAAAAAAVADLRAEAERTIRAGLGVDGANEPLRRALQGLRDAGFELDAALAPNDAALADAAAAAPHKAEGASKFASGDFAGAARSYTAALSWSPGDGVLASNRSAAYAGYEKWGAALRDGRAAARAHPRWAKAANRVATALYGLGRYGDAAEECARGLADARADLRSKADATERGPAQNTATTVDALEKLEKKCAVEAAEPPAAQYHAAELRREAADRKARNMAGPGIFTVGPDGKPVAVDFSAVANSKPGSMGNLDAALRSAAAGNPLSEADLRAEARRRAAREAEGRYDNGPSPGGI